MLCAEIVQQARCLWSTRCTTRLAWDAAITADSWSGPPENADPRFGDVPGRQHRSSDRTADSVRAPARDREHGNAVSVRSCRPCVLSAAAPGQRVLEKSPRPDPRRRAVLGSNRFCRYSVDLAVYDRVLAAKGRYSNASDFLRRGRKSVKNRVSRRFHCPSAYLRRASPMDTVRQ